LITRNGGASVAIPIQLNGGTARVDFIDPTRFGKVDVLDPRSGRNEYRQHCTPPLFQG